MGKGGVYIHIDKRRFCTLWFWRIGISQIHRQVKNKATKNASWGVLYTFSMSSIDFRLLSRGHTIYLHWRGAFGVARFDLSGNARASIREASDRTGSTLFYMYRLRG